MSKITFSWIMISVLVGIVSYFSTDSLIIAFSVFIIFFLYYFLIARKYFVNQLKLIDRVHCCYHFINSFLITLSVKESLEDGYQSATRIDNKNLQDHLENLYKLNVYDRVQYLRKFFNLAIYKMFLNIIDIYQDQGGNVLNMSDNLIRECTRTEKTLNETINISNKHLGQFILLWLLSFGIIMFMRFGVSEFYMLMLSQNIFKGMLFIFFMICLVSTHLFIKKYTSLTIKEDYFDVED